MIKFQILTERLNFFIVYQMNKINILSVLMNTIIQSPFDLSVDYFSRGHPLTLCSRAKAKQSSLTHSLTTKEIGLRPCINKLTTRATFLFRKGRTFTYINIYLSDQLTLNIKIISHLSSISFCFYGSFHQ